MALYVYPKGDFIVLDDGGGVFMYQLHFTELAIDRLFGQIRFLHRRDTTELYPIASEEYSQILDEAGTPYSIVSEPDFLANLRAILPKSTAPSADPAVLTILNSTYERINAIHNGLATDTPQTIAQTSRTAGGYTAQAPTSNKCRKIQIIATAGTFTVGGITYPINTVNGIIDTFEAEATAATTLADITYTVNAASTAIEIIQY